MAVPVAAADDNSGLWRPDARHYCGDCPHHVCPGETPATPHSVTSNTARSRLSHTCGTRLHDDRCYDVTQYPWQSAAAYFRPCHTSSCWLAFACIDVLSASLDTRGERATSSCNQRSETGAWCSCKLSTAERTAGAVSLSSIRGLTAQLLGRSALPIPLSTPPCKRIDAWVACCLLPMPAAWAAAGTGGGWLRILNVNAALAGWHYLVVYRAHAPSALRRDASGSGSGSGSGGMHRLIES